MADIVNNFQDISLICKDCGEQFTFKASEQKFYAKQGFVNAPARCKDCRLKFQEKKFKGQQVYNVKCQRCDKVGKIMIEPPDPRYVYCEECFEEEFTKVKNTTGKSPTSIYEAMKNIGKLTDGS